MVKKKDTKKDTKNDQDRETGVLGPELRRGALVLAILAQLAQERYGYELREALAEHDLAVPEGTLYPILRRLEKQGWLASRWDTSGSRPRRYYRIATAGRKALAAARREWTDLSAALDRLL